LKAIEQLACRDERRNGGVNREIVTASFFQSASRMIFVIRAIMLAEGPFRKPQYGRASARRRRVAHSVTTRRLPLKSSLLGRHQSSAPFWQPAVHASSVGASHSSMQFIRAGKMNRANDEAMKLGGLWVVK